ncbi:hypothetical protein D3C78_1553510 [compost metagenome]
MGEGINNGLFQGRDELANTYFIAFQIHHHVQHLLAWTMIGNLAAAIALDHRDIAWHQQMFCLTGLALGEHGLMLHQPQFIKRGLIAVIGEAVHGLGYRLIGLQP